MEQFTETHYSQGISGSNGKGISGFKGKGVPGLTEKVESKPSAKPPSPHIFNNRVQHTEILPDGKMSDPLAILNWDWLRHEYRPLAQAFIDAAGEQYMPTKREQSLWRQELIKWQQAKATPEHIRLSVERMRKENLTIGGPQSITAILRNLLSEQISVTEFHPVFRTNGGTNP